MISSFLLGGVALTLTVTQCPQNGECSGTEGPDLLRGTGGYDRIFAGDGDDVLRGFDSPDSLKGENGNDRLYGGRAYDLLDGGPGDDTLAGGGGDDHYDLYRDWGHDALVDREVADSDVGTGNLIWVHPSVGESLLVDLASGKDRR